MNTIIIHGRFTADVDVKMTPQSISVCDFTIACDRSYSKGEKITDFIPCRAWRGTADFIGRNFHKGSECVVYGDLRVETYTGKDEKTHKSIYVNVDNIEFAGSRNVASEATAEEVHPEDYKDLPF